MDKNPKIAIVTGGNDTYFPLIQELIHSIRRFPQSKDIDICVMNTGMTDAQHITLKQDGITVTAPDWPVPIAPNKIKGKDYLKSCICRPFIPKIFPGYDLYIWLDGDTWVQDWSAIELLIQGAQKSGLAICPQTDRAYGKSMRLKWLGPFPWKARSFYYSNARKAFSGSIARKLFPFATINVGVFAITATAPHWARWQELIAKALKKGKVFTAEQLTLGMMIYLEKFSAELLPAWCNWLCEHKPAWDKGTKLFVEPYLPHTPIGIVHLSGVDAMREDRSITDIFQTTDGNTINLSYRYPDTLNDIA